MAARPRCPRSEMDDLTAVILDYVKRVCVEEGDDREVGVETPLFSGGIVDRATLLSLRRFLENRYEVRIPDADATPAAFDSVRKIANLVTRFHKAPT